MKAEAQAAYPAGIRQCYAEFAKVLECDLNAAPTVETRELRDRLLVELCNLNSPSGSDGPTVALTS